jgi:hypothetical protein
VLKINSVFVPKKHMVKCLRHSFLDESECTESLWKLFELEVRKIVQLFGYLHQKNGTISDKLQMQLIWYGGAFPKKFADIRSKYAIASNTELMLQLKSSIKFIQAFQEEQQSLYTKKNIEVFLRSLWKYIFVVHFNKGFDNEFSKNLEFLFAFKDVKPFEHKVNRIRLKVQEPKVVKSGNRFEKFAIGVTLSATILFFFVKID